MSQTADMTLYGFIEALASQNPTPGGGGAAAVTGSQAAALVSMVIHFTVGKKKYAAVEEEMQAYLVRSDSLYKELLALADRDVEAFSAVAATYSMPRESDSEKAARTAALQKALKYAAEVPFTVAGKCLEIMELALPVGCKGNVNVVSDAASAVYLAHGALLCAIANVNVNLKAIQDAEFVAEWSVKVETVLGKAAALYAEGRNAIAAVMGVPL